MFGLICKDLKNVRGQAAYYGVILAVLYAVAFWTKNVYFYAGAVVFFSVTVPVSAIAYDEKDEWDAFALAAGMRRRDLVLGRYLLCLSVALPAPVRRLLCEAFVVRNVVDRFVMR